MKLEQLKSLTRKTIELKMPTITPEHDDTGHHYRVAEWDQVFDSVTGKLQILKDEGLMNWKMNQALRHIGNFWFEGVGYTQSQIDGIIVGAKQVPTDKFEDAGNIGTQIHDLREKMFTQIIEQGTQNWDIHLKGESDDVRLISGFRALQKFLTETKYVPIACELPVADKKLRLAGCLDDIGAMPFQDTPGTIGCKHELGENTQGIRCLHCRYKAHWELVLMDLKSSNQFKDHYWLQVALYYHMFSKLTGLRPKRAFILKVSKEDGSYEIEWLKDIPRLIKIAIKTVTLYDDINIVKAMRKKEKIFI